MKRLTDVIGLRKFDCAGVVAAGRGGRELLALLLFLARWSDADRVRFSLGPRAN